jgi:hypothetical protein
MLASRFTRADATETPSGPGSPTCYVPRTRDVVQKAGDDQRVPRAFSGRLSRFRSR